MIFIMINDYTFYDISTKIKYITFKITNNYYVILSLQEIGNSSLKNIF
jgi:hypothetical protein